MAMLSDEDLLKNHWDSGEEMLRRNMVGAELWQTPNGVVTNGSLEAREAILKIYEDAQTGFQEVLDECALKAARNERGENVTTAVGPFEVSKPPKMDRPLSLMTEKNNYQTTL